MDYIGAEWIYNNEYTPKENRCVYFYKSFEASAEVLSAVIYAASTDMFSIFINDKRVNAEFSEVRGGSGVKQIPLFTFDVTDFISEKNELTAVLTSVKRKSQCSDFLFYMVAVIEYADGKTEKIISDGSWQASFGALVSSGGHGEKWDFSSKSHKRANACVNAEKGGYTYLLSNDFLPRLAKSNTIKPKKTGSDGNVYDRGVCALGVASLKLKGKKGSVVKVRYSETEDFSDKAFDEIILSGNEDSFENIFIYRKFRFAEILGEADILNFDAVTLSCNVLRNGDFYCSNSKLNEAYVDNVIKRQAQLTDLGAVISDEKESYEFDMFSLEFRDFAEGMLMNCRAMQAENGCVANRNAYGIFENATLNPIFLLYRHYVMYGDVGVVKENIGMCTKIMSFVDKFSESDDLIFALKLIRASQMMSVLCTAIGSGDNVYFDRLFKSLKSSVVDALKVDELSADILAILYEYKLCTAEKLKNAVLNHSYKEVSPENMNAWLGLLYETGQFDEPYKIICSEGFDKSLCREWLYSDCIGIKPDETVGGAGFKKVIIQPAIDLSYTMKKASGGYITPYGKISVFWEKSDDMYTCCVTVPYEVDATCRFNGFKVVNQKSSRETYVFLLRKN